MYLSPTIGDAEAIHVKLDDIVEIQIIDGAPWSWLRLGALILITAPDSDYQPCIRCFSDPLDAKTGDSLHGGQGKDAQPSMAAGGRR